MGLRESLDEPVSLYMSRDFARVGAEESVYNAANAMQKLGTTEAVVMEGDSPVGIITERDIVYKVVAPGLYPQQVKAKDIMNSPLEMIEESTKALDAISRMSKLGVRRLGVTKNGKMVGMITQKAVVSGDVHRVVPLPELASPHEFSCPYCDASMKSREELSKHIDQVHLGLGLLEGDRTKW